MSLDIKVYCKEISADILPKILQRLNDFDMNVEVHPDFRFDKNEDTGFLPFKFRLKNPRFEILKEKELKSGFELYIDDFDLNKEKEILQPKAGFFDRLLGRKQEEIAFTPPEIENRLKNCDKVVSFVWGAGDSFQVRFASLTSAILTELTNGVCCYPADDIWYDNKDFTNKTFQEILEYENSLLENELKYQEFNEW